MNDFQSKLENAIRWNIIAIAAVMPVIISFWHYDMFDLVKVTFLYLATLLLLTLTAIDKLIIKKRIDWVKTPLDLPILAFLGASTIAVIFSPAPLTSLVGEYSRYEALQTFFAYAIIYQLAAQYLRSGEWLNKLLLAMFAGLTVTVIYGLFQGMGMDVLPRFMQRAENRVRSTMGNAVFFGTYLIIMLTLLLNALLDKKKNLIKTSGVQIWLTLLAIGTFANIILTESRGPWLGLIFGLIALAMLNAKRIKEDWQKIAAFLVVGVLVALIAVTIGSGGKPAAKIGGVFSRLYEIGTLRGSTGSRLEIWKASKNMFLDRPLTGYGVDQSQFFLPKYKTLRHSQIEKLAVPDKAHNEYLQILLDSGIIGGLAFLWLLIAAYIAWRKRSDQYAFYLSGIGAAFVAYLVQAITGISMVGTLSVIAVLAGVTAAIAEPEARLISVGFPGRVVLPSFAVSLVALTAIILAYIALMPFRADMSFYSAMKKSQNPSYGKAVLVDEIRMTNSLWPYQGYYTYAWARWLMDLAIETESSDRLKESIKASENGLLYNPYYSDLYLSAGRSYITLGRVLDDDTYVRKGEAYLKVKLEMAPLDPQTHDSLAKLYMNDARYKEAIVHLEILTTVFPNEVRHLESLALAYESVGRMSDANKAYRKIKILDPSFANIDVNIERTSGALVQERPEKKSKN